MDFARIPNEDLYEMCLRGDEPAWEYVYRYVLVIARSPRWRLNDTPEDMAQDIVCHLLNKGIEQVRSKQAFRGFVKRVAVNRILDAVKRKRIFYGSLDADCDDDDRGIPEPKGNDPAPDEIVLGNELVTVFSLAVKSLSDMCRDALGAYIRYKMGEYANYQDLAEALGKKMGTVSAQIKRCLDQLRGLEEIKEWLEV